MLARTKKYLKSRIWSRGPIGTITRLITRQKFQLDVDHLQGYPEEDAMGPLQRSGALLLFSLVQVIRPRVILEFGFNDGHSALNFLLAGGRNCHVYSYDLNNEVQSKAEAISNRFTNFTFHLKSQADFSAEDLNGECVDFVFIDASHDLQLNMTTWDRLKPTLSATATIVVHDTGLWNRGNFRPIHKWFVDKGFGKWVSTTEFAHQPDERMFVDWIVDDASEFVAIHCHSQAVIRHGLTILQRRQSLNSR